MPLTCKGEGSAPLPSRRVAAERLDDHLPAAAAAAAAAALQATSRGSLQGLCAGTGIGHWAGVTAKNSGSTPISSARWPEWFAGDCVWPDCDAATSGPSPRRPERTRIISRFRVSGHPRLGRLGPRGGKTRPATSIGSGTATGRARLRRRAGDSDDERATEGRAARAEGRQGRARRRVGERGRNRISKAEAARSTWGGGKRRCMASRDWGRRGVGEGERPLSLSYPAPAQARDFMTTWGRRGVGTGGEVSVARQTETAPFLPLSYPAPARKRAGTETQPRALKWRRARTGTEAIEIGDGLKQFGRRRQPTMDNRGHTDTNKARGGQGKGRTRQEIDMTDEVSDSERM